MGFPEGWSMAAKPCDSCKSAGAALFCRADSAFLCLTCDSKIHEANRLVARHERVWLCEVCEQAPASVTCKADAAALCVTCDRDIHSANPLARRHERVPVVPFYDTAEAVIKSTATATATASTTGDDFLVHTSDDSITVKTDHTCVGDEEVPWIDLPNSGPKHLPDATEMKSIDFFFSDSDQFLDFDYPISMNAYHNLGTDSVVPVQIVKADHSSDSQFEIDFTQSKFKSYNNYNNNNSSSSYTHQSLSHSVSSSSMDVGIVPDGGSISEMSHTFAQSMNNSSINLSGGSENNTIMANQGSSQLSGLDREARVLRYREKRKNRKFEKTIRYASRKAYAEMRPRIKGRFAKRTEIEIETETETEVDHLFNSDSAAFMADAGGYGVVPSF